MDAFVLPGVYLPYPARLNPGLERAREHTLDRQSAAGVVANLMTERMKQFERLVAVGLPALAEQQGLDAAARAAPRRQARLLRDYMAGVLAWHRATARYTVSRTFCQCHTARCSRG